MYIGMHRYEHFVRYPIILYIWKQITDMFADKSISKYVYTFWDPDLKPKPLQPKQPSLNSVSLKIYILLSHYQISP